MAPRVSMMSAALAKWQPPAQLTTRRTRPSGCLSVPDAGLRGRSPRLPRVLVRQVPPAANERPLGRL